MTGLGVSCPDFSPASPTLTLRDDVSELYLILHEAKERAYWRRMGNRVELFSTRELQPGDWLVSPYCGGAQLALTQELSGALVIAASG